MGQQFPWEKPEIWGNGEFLDFWDFIPFIRMGRLDSFQLVASVG
jgi:hypothetical protein